MPWYIWGWAVWAFVAGTFGVVMFFRALIGSGDDALVTSDAELLRNARNRRQATLGAQILGAVSAVMFVILTLATLKNWKNWGQ